MSKIKEEPEQKYLTPLEVASKLVIKESLLSNWRLRGNGPAYVKLGGGKKGLIRYPLYGESGLINYMEKHTKNSTSN